MTKLEKIFQEEKNNKIVEYFISKKQSWDKQTIYGDLCDWMRDYHNDLSLAEREEIIQRLIGQYVIRNIYKVKLWDIKGKTIQTPFEVGKENPLPQAQRS